MSSGGQRQAVFPTRMALTTLKQREAGAKKGYDLLKKKSDALQVRLRAMLVEIKQVRNRGNIIFLCGLSGPAMFDSGVSGDSSPRAALLPPPAHPSPSRPTLAD